MRFKIRGLKLRNRQGLTYGRAYINGKRTSLYKKKNGNWIWKYKKDIRGYRNYE